MNEDKIIKGMFTAGVVLLSTALMLKMFLLIGMLGKNSLDQLRINEQKIQSQLRANDVAVEELRKSISKED